MDMWMPLKETDIPAVDKIAQEIHPTLPERIETFAEKQKLFSQGCFAFMRQEKVSGYAISYPWRMFSIPPLDTLFVTLPKDPDCIFVHDVAILPHARGHNAAGQFIDIISDVARKIGVRRLTCVAVYGTHVLWSRFGFRDMSSRVDPKTLSAYTKDAHYMVADII